MHLYLQYIPQYLPINLHFVIPSKWYLAPCRCPFIGAERDMSDIYSCIQSRYVYIYIFILCTYIYIYMEFTWWNIQKPAPDLDFQDQFHEILWIFSENRLQRQDSIHQQCWMIRIPITPVDDECSITSYHEGSYWSSLPEAKFRRSSPQNSSGERFRWGTSHPGETRGLGKTWPQPLEGEDDDWGFVYLGRRGFCLQILVPSYLIGR